MASNAKIYERINQLAFHGDKKTNKSNKDSINESLIDFERTSDGTAIGIVKESHHYLLKKSRIGGSDLKLTDFIHINGLENKTNYSYDSLSEAQKQRNFLIKNINEAYDTSGYVSLNESNETKKTNLDDVSDINSFLKERINLGKKSLQENKEKKFKDSLKENKLAGNTNKKSLLPEAANIAIKKALGKVNEEALTTKDSNINSSESPANMENAPKEKSTAPVNDENAKNIADTKNVNSAKEVPSGDLSTSDSMAEIEKTHNPSTAFGAEKYSKGQSVALADSNIEAKHSVANMTGSKEEAQAPINDKNAKEEAEKKTSSSSVNEDESKGEPFNEKTKGGSKDISTEDSMQTDSDRIDNEKKVEKEQAPYNNHNQPEKGHKEEKGEELKPLSHKKDIVAEGEAIATSDSEIEAAKALANLTNTNLPNDHGKDLSTEDSELEAEKSLANDTKTNLPDAIAEGEDLQNEAEGEEDIENAAEKIDDLEMADELEDAKTNAPSNDDTANGDQEGDTQEPDVEVDVKDDNLENEKEVDVEIDTDGGDESSEESNTPADDDITKEIEKLLGKANQKIQGAELEPVKAKSLLNSVIGSFEENLKGMDVEDRKEMSDKILKAQGGSVESDTSAADTEGESTASGLDKEQEVEIDKQINKLDSSKNTDSGEAPAEQANESEEEYDGMTFEEYCESRGYSKDDLKECSSDEMGNMISNYADMFKRGECNGDLEKVAIFISPEVADEIADYGHTDYLDQLQPYMKKIEEAGMMPGHFEPMPDDKTPNLMGSDQEDFDIEEQDQANPKDRDMARKDASQEYEIERPQTEALKDVLNDMGYNLDDMGDIPSSVLKKAFEKVDNMVKAKNENVPAVTTTGNASTDDIDFAPVGDNLGVHSPTTSNSDKSVSVNLNNNTVDFSVNEAKEEKIKKYVRTKLEELAGKRKSSINESKKGELKKLDKLIENLWVEATNKLNSNK